MKYLLYRNLYLKIKLEHFAKMKFSKIILGAALFAKSIYGYEINIVKPEYQSNDVTLSDNIFDIIDKTVENISSYSINQNEVIFNVDSRINRKVIDLIDVIDDEAMKYIGNNEIKVNYPVLSLYMDKYKNLYDQYNVSINKSLEADNETDNDNNDLARRDVGECMTNTMIGFGVSCLTGPAGCAAGGVGLMLGSVACYFFN